MSDPVAEALLVLETELERAERNLTEWTSALASEHLRYQDKIASLELDIASSVARRDVAYEILKAARGVLDEGKDETHE